MEKTIVKAGNRLKSVAYNNRHKYNTQIPPKGRCAYCLEKVTFRVVIIDNINQLICTRCLKSARLYKTMKLIQNRMFFKGKLTFTDKVKRRIYRIQSYFAGNHVFYAFKIRRRSDLGHKITKLLLRFKG